MCHLAPKQIPGVLHNSLPFSLLQLEPSSPRGSGELASGVSQCLVTRLPEAVTPSPSWTGWATLCEPRRLLTFSNAFAAHSGAFSKGLHEILGDPSNPARL